MRRRSGRDFLVGEVEDLAGRRVAHGAEQRHAFGVELRGEGACVDAPHFPREHVVDAVDDAERPRLHEVPGRDREAGSGHRRAGHSFLLSKTLASTTNRACSPARVRREKRYRYRS